jgi:hypothetical protein
MRFYAVLAAGSAVVLWTAAAAAQSTAPVKPRPQPAPQLPKPAPQAKLDPRTAAAAGITADQARHLRTLQAAGLQVPPSSLQRPVVLTVRRPWIDSRTYLNLFEARDFRPDAGYAVMQPNPGTANVSWAEVRWPADAAKRHIIDCEVGGQATRFAFKRVAPGGYSGDPNRIREVTVPVSDGRAAAVFNPGEGGSIFVRGLDRPWQLKSCEITPVA